MDSRYERHDEQRREGRGEEKVKKVKKRYGAVCMILVLADRHATGSRSRERKGKKGKKIK
jgi:hypothetical protein